MAKFLYNQINFNKMFTDDFNIVLINEFLNYPLKSYESVVSSYTYDVQSHNRVSTSNNQPLDPSSTSNIQAFNKDSLIKNENYISNEIEESYKIPHTYEDIQSKTASDTNYYKCIYFNNSLITSEDIFNDKINFETVIEHYFDFILDMKRKRKYPIINISELTSGLVTQKAHFIESTKFGLNGCSGNLNATIDQHIDWIDSLICHNEALHSLSGFSHFQNFVTRIDKELLSDYMNKFNIYQELHSEFDLDTDYV